MRDSGDHGQMNTLQETTAPEFRGADAGTWPSVLTVVLNWRRPDETLACVRSLLDIDYPNQRVLVVGNSAGASGIDTVLSGLPVEIIRNPANLGFTGGVNVGLRHALATGADYAWLMNSDATAAPEALRRLVAAAEADPRLLHGVVRLAPGAQHPVAHRLQAVPVRLELFCQPVLLAHRSESLVAIRHTRV